MKLISLILVTIVGVIGLAGCKPKTISGQVFISSESGLGLPIGNVQIYLIDGKEAETFLSNKVREVKAESEAVRKDMAKLRTEQEAAGQNALKVKAANDQYIENQSWTNDPRCIRLLDESEKGVKTCETLVKAVEYLASKYGRPPDFIVASNTREQKAAWAAMEQDRQKAEALLNRSKQIDREYTEIMNRLIGEKQWETREAQQRTEAIQSEYGIAARSLAGLQTDSHYLSDFNPTSVETSLTDEAGNFTIKASRKNTKIFAKIKLDELGISYFWLVDLPPKGKKLVLSNNNVFTIPTSFSVSSSQ